MPKAKGLNLSTSFALAGLAASSGILGTVAVQAGTERKLSLSGSALATKEGQAQRLLLLCFPPSLKPKADPSHCDGTGTR